MTHVLEATLEKSFKVTSIERDEKLHTNMNMQSNKYQTNFNTKKERRKQKWVWKKFLDYSVSKHCYLLIHKPNKSFGNINNIFNQNLIPL